MSLVEVNFDGIVGPSHNYAGLSLGNLAATSNAGTVSYPRAAALQGIAKMRGNLALGLPQGFFVPPPRPDDDFLTSLAVDEHSAPELTAMAWSASAMWAANAATVSPAPDSADGRCHLTVANLRTMPHRSLEWPATLRQLRLAFAGSDFHVHGPIPQSFGDEGAANHMRFAAAHGAPGVEVFVYGRSGGPFPARQHEQASRAIARRHGLDPRRTVFVEQNPAAIAAGAFHNDVVAVANERVLFTHAEAFADQAAAYAAIAAAFPALEVIEVPASAVSLPEAIATYLFNAQLVTLPGDDGMALVVPTECSESAAVSSYLADLVAGNGPIRRVVPVDVRQSMANGGGPACLRLRVVCEPASVDPRFLLDERRAAAIEAIIARHWPEQIDPADLGRPALKDAVQAARRALLDALDLAILG